MLRHSAIFRVYLNNLVTPASCVCQRNYAIDHRNYGRNTKHRKKFDFTVRPVGGIHVLNQYRIKDDIRDVSQIPLDKETQEMFQDLDVQFEPDLTNVAQSYVDYKREMKGRKIKGKRQKLQRRHFKDLLEKPEINVLTWAEKEAIRHLSQTFPDEWTPDTIADSFPITAEGAEKLIKSKYALYSQKEITRHDEYVKQRIEDIKDGLIELTPELREKMELREKIPLKVGVIPTDTKTLTISMTEEKPLGEFARIVASPKKIRESDARYAHSSYDKIQERQKNIDDLFSNEMSRLNIKQGRKLTLSQLEEKLQKPSTDGQTLKELVPEVGYLLGLGKDNMNKDQSANPHEFNTEDSSTNKPFVRTHIQKFKTKGDDQQSKPTEVVMDQGQAYIYDDKTGYQRPYASSDTFVPSIEIPENQRVPGATYRVGDSFYDEDGQFLYRVV